MIEELEIVVDSALAPHRTRHHNYFRAGRSRDGLRRVQLEVGLCQDDPGVLTLYGLDKFARMGPAGRDSWLRLDLAN